MNEGEAAKGNVSGGGTVHDARVRMSPGGGCWRAHCSCGWRSDPVPDSSTGWSFAKDHVAYAISPPPAPDDRFEGDDTDNCTHKGCGNPLVDHEWGLFCP